MIHPGMQPQRLPPFVLSTLLSPLEAQSVQQAPVAANKDRSRRQWVDLSTGAFPPTLLSQPRGVSGVAQFPTAILDSPAAAARSPGFLLVRTPQAPTVTG
ncbi:hypothetical protein NDU88_000927 [Pleurodeles waltl]|uniref:Secreted protein n=1 Tax=Pleurodeles waltl TaxID=8319 RepID=A0AAV7N9K1_PLEWA|nr:hypothetical protein NDU88_000927 [Pleurodeles waltl]